MANISIHGRVIDERGVGIAGLTVRALDFDPFFSEDDVLGVGKTEGDGTFLISYSPDAYRTWKVDRGQADVVEAGRQIPSQQFQERARFLHVSPDGIEVG